MAEKLMSEMRRAILDYIDSYTAENGFAPSMREITAAMGLKSPSTVYTHIKKLEEAGYLSQSKGKTRSLMRPGRSGYRSVPVVGTVRAGAPILATEDVVGYVPYEGAGDELFGLTVRGDSMKDAAILEGDVVIVRRQPTADNGQIVVALLEDEATVKRLKRTRGHIWLMPENSEYKPINGDECTILGVVVAVYRTDVR